MLTAVTTAPAARVRVVAIRILASRPIRGCRLDLIRCSWSRCGDRGTRTDRRGRAAHRTVRIGRVSGVRTSAVVDVGWLLSTGRLIVPNAVGAYRGDGEGNPRP